MIGFGPTAMSESAGTGLLSYGHVRIDCNKFHLIPPDLCEFLFEGTVPGFQDFDWATFYKFGPEELSGWGKCSFNSDPVFVTSRFLRR